MCDILLLLPDLLDVAHAEFFALPLLAEIGHCSLISADLGFTSTSRC